MFTYNESRQSMRCREARAKLTELARGTLAGSERDALNRHLDHCSRCAQLAIAEQLLARDFQQLRRLEPSPIMTVGQVRQRIFIREESENKRNLGEKIMRHISKAVYRQSRLSIASAATLILLLASVLVPVKTKYAIKYEVAFAAPSEGLVLDKLNTQKLLAALNLTDAQIGIIEGPEGIEYKIAPLADTTQVNRLVALLDSSGGEGSHRVLATALPGAKRTIWELLLDNQPDPSRLPIGDVNISVDEFSNLPSDNFVLWIPDNSRQSDSMAGILINAEDGKKNIWMPGLKLEPDDCGWHQYLNNSVLNTETPDGKKSTFYLYKIEDVRKLEKMGYNFATMKWGEPRQVPIPDMGPKLNKITTDSFTNKVAIEYMIPQAYEVRLQIIDERGREIRKLLECMPLAGIYQITWDESNNDEIRVKPGNYLCQLTAGDYVETQNITLGH